MRHGLSSSVHSSETHQSKSKIKHAHIEDFVLEKSIFNNIFEKDIRRVFIYKKAERLAKAISLVSPAFQNASPLKARIEALAISLVDTAALPSSHARAALSRDLLSLSSMLSMARIGGVLSPMNADIIAHEAHALLKEIALYDEPRIPLDEPMTLSEIAKNTSKKEKIDIRYSKHRTSGESAAPQRIAGKGHIKDNNKVDQSKIKDRREAVLSVIRIKGKASIKDISTLVRGVSEKTIQRELSALVAAREVLKQGERRWSTYSLPAV